MEIGTYHSMELQSFFFALWHTVYGYLVLLTSVIRLLGKLTTFKMHFYFPLKVLTRIGYSYWSSIDTSSLTVTNITRFHFTLI